MGRAVLGWKFVQSEQKTVHEREGMHDSMQVRSQNSRTFLRESILLGGLTAESDPAVDSRYLSEFTVSLSS